MRWLIPLLLLTVARLAFTQAVDEQAQPIIDPPAPGPAVRFEAVEVYVDSGEAPLAAYQVQLGDRAGRVQVVGVENGEHAAFGSAPFYDREAVNAGKADRVILAAFSTADPKDLPTGRTRVATVHLRVAGEEQVDYQATLIAAARADGAKIPAKLTIERGEKP
jgi:hypothetical protein